MDKDWIFDASEKSNDWNLTKKQEDLDLVIESVKKMFSDIPDELVVIFCESGLNELNKRGLIVLPEIDE
ncbi:MAG: hypothetical protein KatS3mg087_0564 [Patescibacteria group bacterium]|nr:MAG: hypothetical protein KatS3mg087_0564 [Patescibacteria group bacterium]